MQTYNIECLNQSWKPEVTNQNSCCCLHKNTSGGPSPCYATQTMTTVRAEHLTCFVNLSSSVLYYFMTSLKIELYNCSVILNENQLTWYKLDRIIWNWSISFLCRGRISGCTNFSWTARPTPKTCTC